jgi:two-component sensor histidine kinase/putative methionine-R-sulfoxide reductase with GAF domain/ActR/RegA family two-component response regulator
MPKVIIAEDDLYMADMLEEILVDNNYEVCGIGRTVDETVALGERYKPDLAILDIRLAAGGLGTDIVDRWPKRDRPGILYATAYVGQTRLTRSDGEASLAKPYRPEDVIRALEIVQELVSTGNASRPYPHGLSLLNGSGESDAASGDHTGAAEEIARLRRQQAALASFGTYALGERDLVNVLAEAARICASSLNVPYCKICRYRSGENDLLVEAGTGWHQGVVGQVVSVADASTPQGRAFTTKQPVICEDLRHDTSYVLPSFYREHGVVSTVDVIIQSADGTPYGVLEIDSPTQHNYDEHDIAFLTGFANIVAEAVSTAHRRSAMELSVRRMQDIIGDREQLIEAKDALLAENAVMARELHHRVRNNLQLIHSMLNRQIQFGGAGSARDATAGIARRVMALAQVYENLLGTGLSNAIDFGKYIEALCKDTESSVGSDRPDIKLSCHSMSLRLGLDSVTSLGLAVSEVIANSYAHAFPGAGGSINVSVEPSENDEGIVIVTDDGVGLVEPATNTKSHGVGLIRRLMEQIGGSATFRAGQGTEWTLRFPLPPALRDAASVAT